MPHQRRARQGPDCHALVLALSADEGEEALRPCRSWGLSPLFRARRRNLGTRSSHRRVKARVRVQLIERGLVFRGLGAFFCNS
jgi:hypothetical protein